MTALDAETMLRRTVLRVLAGATGSVAGCGTRTIDLHETPDEPTGTASPSPVPDGRVFRDVAVSERGLAVEATWWAAFDRLRYRTDEGGRAFVEPDEGQIVAYAFELTNRGDESASALPDTQFRLRTGSATYEHVHELPGGVAFAQLDQPPGEPRVRELSWYRRLRPGASVSLQLVFVTRARHQGPFYLEWDANVPVEGTDRPAYLLGERRQVA